MKIALLSCGRSDFSIYLPLLKKLKQDAFFELDVIAFGTHVSRLHGYTINAFTEQRIEVAHAIESLVLGDSPDAIASSMGLTTTKMASVWKQKKYDLVICLGDRYEMFAAVSSIVPFNYKIAHLHGGETTLGAIDDVFRHAITAMSHIHFTSTQKHADRVAAITGSAKNVFNVGAMALDNINEIKLFSLDEMKKKFGVDLSIPSVLVTFHPETISPENNIHHTQELIAVLSKLSQQIIITMPNADTMGNAVREELQKFISENKNVIGIENFGTVGYYSCLQYVEFLIGNSSSGIIEAASFSKYVINIGDRQKGRDYGNNVLHCSINKNEILSLVDKIKNLPKLSNDNIYGNGNTSAKIVQLLKTV